jgi:ribosomal protein S9
VIFRHLSQTHIVHTTNKTPYAIKTKVKNIKVHIAVLFFWGGGSGTESTITEAITGLLNQPQMIMDDDDECRPIGGMLGRDNRRTRRKPPIVPLCPP